MSRSNRINRPAPQVIAFDNKWNAKKHFWIANREFAGISFIYLLVVSCSFAFVRSFVIIIILCVVGVVGVWCHKMKYARCDGDGDNDKDHTCVNVYSTHNYIFMHENGEDNGAATNMQQTHIHTNRDAMQKWNEMEKKRQKSHTTTTTASRRRHEKGTRRRGEKPNRPNNKYRSWMNDWALFGF